MNFRRLRAGELVVLVGVACVIASLLAPWYDSAGGHLSVWDTFGPAVVLLLMAAVGALALILASALEGAVALPVALAVWNVPLGLLALVSAFIRLVERPDHATGLLGGAWLGLAGAV